MRPKGWWKYRIRALRPKYWYQQKPFSKEWDELLLRLLREYRFQTNSQYTAELGDYKIWIENHPFASFHPDGMTLPEVRPARATIIYAHERLMNDAFAQPADVVELEAMYERKVHD